MSFYAQVKRAKGQTLSKSWRNDRVRVADDIRASNTAGIKRHISNSDFSSFAGAAYAAKHGYAIRRNPKTGEKEMFVRGTTFRRGGVEWLQNVLESPLSSVAGGGTAVSGDVSRYFRGKYSKFLSDVAKKERVDVIYGHSRGAAVVEDMRVPGAVKLGLDGATILNRKRSITNYRQRQGFDALIGLNAKKTIREKRWTPVTSKRYHRVYGK